MPKTRRYYFSRLSKAGNLDQTGIINALQSSIAVSARKYAWTILEPGAEDTVSFRSKSHKYVSGRLVKYDPEGVVEVVDEQSRRSVPQLEPNLQEASTTFLYFPDHEMFVHARVYNHISDLDFRNRIVDIIEEFHQRFFVECDVQPFADIEHFVRKLATLQTVVEIRAEVRPPNPLFSPFWKELKEYMKRRRLKKLHIKELAKHKASVPSALPEIANTLDTPSSPDAVEPAEIADAAVLLAADGYGSAEIAGNRDGNEVVVRTKDSAIQIRLDAEATVPQIARAAIAEIVRQQSRRRLKH